MNFNTPFKGGKSNHLHLNWLFYALMTSDTIEEDYIRFENFENNLNNFYKTVSGKTRSYVDNTKLFFNELKKFTEE